MILGLWLSFLPGIPVCKRDLRNGEYVTAVHSLEGKCVHSEIYSKLSCSVFKNGCEASGRRLTASSSRRVVYLLGDDLRSFFYSFRNKSIFFFLYNNFTLIL